MSHNPVALTLSLKTTDPAKLYEHPGGMVVADVVETLSLANNMLLAFWHCSLDVMTPLPLTLVHSFAPDSSGNPNGPVADVRHDPPPTLE